jgi:hypothetical protein
MPAPHAHAWRFLGATLSKCLGQVTRITLLQHVGRPILAAAAFQAACCARPWIFLGINDQVSLNAVELCQGSYQMIVALVLPWPGLPSNSFARCEENDASSRLKASCGQDWPPHIV